MILLHTIALGLIGLMVVVLVTPAILRLAERFGPARSSDFHHHHRKRASVPAAAKQASGWGKTAGVPRYGGLALACAYGISELLVCFFLTEARANVPERIPVVVGCLAMFALGFLDDIRPLGAKRKLIGQFLIASGVYFSGIGIETMKIPVFGEVVELGLWGYPATVMWLVGITNLINLIDGVDGLAAGVGLALMGLLVALGYHGGTFALVSAGVTGALAGFLWFNFAPARIYLGDGGAYLVGFQLAGYSLISSHKGTVVAALIAPLFVLALPIIDTSLAILRRGAKGLPVFRADRHHIHHRLMRLGMSHRTVVLWLYGATVIFLSAGFAAFWTDGRLLPVLFGVGLLLVLWAAGRLRFSRNWFSVGQSVGVSLEMREQVQYALTLTGWFRNEAERCQSVEELYPDLLFVAHRLGFSKITLRYGEFERSWRPMSPDRELKRYRYLVSGERPGILELDAPLSRVNGNGNGHANGNGHPIGNGNGQGNGQRNGKEKSNRNGNHHPEVPVKGTHPRVLEMAGELLAEAYQKAVADFESTFGHEALGNATQAVESPGPHCEQTVAAGGPERKSSSRVHHRRLASEVLEFPASSAPA